MRTRIIFREECAKSAYKAKEYEFDDDNDDEFLSGEESDYEFEEDDETAGSYVDDEYEFDEEN
ncbi:MAG: hypothetical protein E7088_09150 [Bacteroidales bacterium]|nr:hypothetical protein [Bacteroidales bacterium]